MWLADYGFDTANRHDEELRVGENSREKCWERFISLAGWKRENIRRIDKTNAEMIPDSTKVTYKIVSQKPLLPGISINKFNGEALYIYQGKLTHQNSKTFMKLNKESDNAEGEFLLQSSRIVPAIHHRYVGIVRISRVYGCKKYMVGSEQKSRRLWQL